MLHTSLCFYVLASLSHRFCLYLHLSPTALCDVSKLQRDDVFLAIAGEAEDEREPVASLLKALASGDGQGKP